MAPLQPPGNIAAEFPWALHSPAPGAPRSGRSFISLLYCSGWAACKGLPEGLRNAGTCLSMHLGRNEERVIKGRGGWGDYASLQA